MKIARSLENIVPKTRTRSHLFKTGIVATALLVTMLAVSPTLARAPQTTLNAPGQDVPPQANGLTRTPTPNITETPSPKESPTPTAYPTTLPSTLMGRLFTDANSNGIYDEGEGIANVLVNVADSNSVTHTIFSDLRGGFVLSLPAGLTLITVNDNTLPNGIVLMSGLNPSQITLLGGTLFSFSLGYRAQLDVATRIAPTPILQIATPTPAVSPTVTASAPITSNTSNTANAAVEVVLISKATVSSTLATSYTLPTPVAVQLGDQIDYTVTVKATNANASDLTVSVPVPDGTEYIAGSAWPSDERTEARVPQSLRHTVGWRIKPMSNGQMFTAHFSVRVVVGTGSIVAKASASNASTGQSINSNEVVNKSKPTAVALLRFDAVPTSTGIKVIWQTGTELDTFGFAIYRNMNSTSRNSAVLLNNVLIPSRGEIGAEYEFEDTTAVPGQQYAYWLREYEVNSVINEYGPLQASTATQTTTSVVVPSNVMAGGVPVVVPLPSGAQSIQAPATPAVNVGGVVQPLVTSVVQQQVIVVPTLDALPPDNRGVVVQPLKPQPTSSALGVSAQTNVIPTPEPARPPADQNGSIINTQTVIEPTPTPAVLTPSDIVASVATIAAPTTPQAAPPTPQSKPLAPVAKSSAPIRETNRTAEPANRQTNLGEWIIWALVIFVVWFVVAGILGIALGQYLRQR